MISFGLGMLFGAILAVPLKNFITHSWKEMKKIKDEVEKS